MNAQEIAAFWSAVQLPDDLDDPELCWLYRDDAIGDRGRYGHVRVRIRGRRVFVHRVAFGLHGGVLTPELDLVTHRCDIGRCAGRFCLRAGNRLTNARERDERGRRDPFLKRGPDSPSAKLTRPEIDALRRARVLGVPAKTLAEAFGVSLATVYSHIAEQP